MGFQWGSGAVCDSGVLGGGIEGLKRLCERGLVEPVRCDSAWKAGRGAPYDPHFRDENASVLLVLR